VGGGGWAPTPQPPLPNPQSPIPNPQSPLISINSNNFNYVIYLLNFKNLFNKMFVTANIDENQNIDLKSKDSGEIKGDWNTLCDELFFRKNKFEFTPKEKHSLKKMLSQSPPQLQYRRKVINIYYFFLLLFYYLAMVN